MRPVALVALNCVRENRWPIALMLAWIVASLGLFGGFSASPVERDDVLFFFRQQALYIVIFAIFLSATTLHNDRKSRRILLVLSKAISRTQYLAGILLSVAAVVLLECVGLWIAGGLLVQKATHQVMNGADVYVLGILLVALAGSSLSLLLATMLNSYLASAITAAVLALSPWSSETSAWNWIAPAASLLRDLSLYDLSPGWHPRAGAMASAAIWSLALIALAAAIFNLVDIAVAAD